MVRRQRGGGAPRAWALTVLVGLGVGAPALAFEQRSNTVSVGVQGGFVHVLRGDGEYERGETAIPYDSYGSGPGFAIHLRYSLDRSHAIGLTFEDQRFDRERAVVEETGEEVPRQYQLNTFLFDYYLYYHRKSKLSRYLVLGAGFHRPSLRITDHESFLPGEGLSANLGGGLEYFVARPLAIDGSVRLHLDKVKGGTLWSAEWMLGFQYYLLQ